MSDRPGVLVETSALVAIALEESDWPSLTRQALASECVTTAVNMFEAVLALAKQASVPHTQAQADLAELAARLSIALIPVSPDMLPHAVAARERYGRGRKRLNMGDCLSYAAAKTLGLKLLYRGDDFDRTDVDR